MTQIVALSERYLDQAIAIWNTFIDAGLAFPQVDLLDAASGRDYFAEQAYVALALDAEKDEVLAVTTVYSNNVGCCAFLCYGAVAFKTGCFKAELAKELFRAAMAAAKQEGFRVLQVDGVFLADQATQAVLTELGFRPSDPLPLEGEALSDELVSYFVEV